MLRGVPCRHMPATSLATLPTTSCRGMALQLLHPPPCAHRCASPRSTHVVSHTPWPPPPSSAFGQSYKGASYDAPYKFYFNISCSSLFNSSSLSVRSFRGRKAQHTAPLEQRTTPFFLSVALVSALLWAPVPPVHLRALSSSFFKGQFFMGIPSFLLFAVTCLIKVSPLSIDFKCQCCTTPSDGGG